MLLPAATLDLLDDVHVLGATDSLISVVFFSSNRFVVHDFRIFLPWSTPDDSTLEAQGEGEDETATEETGVSEYHSDRLAASVFLREKVPPRMLRELRELEFVFPPYRHTGWPGEGHPALIDWAETLYWARDRMNLIGVKLRLVMAVVLDLDGPPPGRGEINKRAGRRDTVGVSSHYITPRRSVSN
ncbi:hypothetical protein LA080_015016 [Diaporthe eres]|nr:hypothetical protein LA080_015016 [Diaporthe eres]